MRAHRQIASDHVLDAAGNPVIALSGFVEGAEPGLYVVRCTDPVCADGDPTPSLIAPMVGSGQPEAVAITLDAAGNPVIVFGEGLVRCNDPGCTSGGDVSLALDGADRPITTVRYQDTNVALVFCEQSMCSGISSTQVLPSANVADVYATTTLDDAGLPIVTANTRHDGTRAGCT